jgi:hypothetical protein
VKDAVSRNGILIKFVASALWSIRQDGVHRAGGVLIGVGCSTVSRSSPLETSGLVFHLTFDGLQEIPAEPRIPRSPKPLVDLECTQGLRF